MNETDATLRLRASGHLLPALRILLDIHATRCRRKKTDIIVGLGSTRSWYAHLSGEWVISSDTFETYKRHLAINSNERIVMDALFSAYRAEQVDAKARRGSHLSQAETFHGLGTTDLSVKHDFTDFLQAARLNLDSRVTQVTDSTRFADLINDIESGRIYSANSNERQAKAILVGFMLHLKAYNTSDATAQEIATSAIDRYAHLSGVPHYDYLRRAIRLYAFNPQDLTWNSSRSLGVEMQALLLDEFGKLRGLVDTMEASGDLYLAKIVNFTRSIGDYNILSLRAEAEAEDGTATMDRLHGLEQDDLDRGVPLYSAVYNWFPVIEQHLQKGRFEQAIDMARRGIGTLEREGFGGLVSEIQFRIKLARAYYGCTLNAGTDRTANIAELFSELDKIVFLATVHNNQRIVSEFINLRSVFAVKFGLV